ncbi:MAG: DMT family transporter [Treponema sp.]|nr:DMT family transporter [Treponema sp.]
MNKRILEADALLLLTACIWGFGFVAQRSGMEYIGPFAFNGIRFLMGSLSLFPLIVIKLRGKSDESATVKIRRIIPSAFIAGTCCFIAVTLQQLGIMFTTAGNAGFITGLYVVMTPIFGIFIGRKTGPATWAGTVFTFAGLFFISIAGKSNHINPGDLLVAAGAIFWTIHVLLIDAFVKKHDPIILSSGQFMACGLYSLVCAFTVEPLLASGIFTWIPFPALLHGLNTGAVPFNSVSGAVIPVLYGGLASVGIAYTLQTVAQKNAPPAHATIILCLEGCFAAIGGIMLLHEPLGVRTILGFALMLSGMLVSQWEVIFKKPVRV